jgi:hypothetical protein
LNPSISRSQAYAQQRRSQRILLSIPVVVAGEHANGSPFTERTKTQIVNAHGALIHLHVPVLTGQVLRIKNIATNEEVACTVVDINPGSADIPEIGVAFAYPNPCFWRVSFPPEDWSPKSPEAKRVSYSADPVRLVLIKIGREETHFPQVEV